MQYVNVNKEGPPSLLSWFTTRFNEGNYQLTRGPHLVLNPQKMQMVMHQLSDLFHQMCNLKIATFPETNSNLAQCFWDGTASLGWIKAWGNASAPVSSA